MPAGDDVFAIEMLPARQGDCIWIEYGPRDKPYRMLIDGGTPPTVDDLTRRMAVVEGTCRFELLVITHIDTDHIGGMLKLLSRGGPQMEVGEGWFNGFDQLPGPKRAVLGPLDGEILMQLLKASGIPWNERFHGGAVAAPTKAEDALPEFTFPGGMTITVLSPTGRELTDLRTNWQKVLKDEGLDGTDLDAGIEKAMRRKGVALPGTLGAVPNVPVLARSAFHGDASPANESSIALLAEYGTKSLLLTGDIWASSLQRGVEQLAKQRGQPGQPLEVTALKVGHHGSRNNTSLELLRAIRTKRFLVSTNGAQYHHPDMEAIARLIQAGGPGTTFYFNYETTFNEPWRNALSRNTNQCEVVPPDVPGHLRVEL